MWTEELVNVVISCVAAIIEFPPCTRKYIQGKLIFFSFFFFESKKCMGMGQTANFMLSFFYIKTCRNCNKRPVN